MKINGSPNWDKNAEGQITSDEVRPAMRKGRAAGGCRAPEHPPRNEIVEDTVKSLLLFDANGDGKLSRTELPERIQGIFDCADGVVSAEEIRNSAEAIRKLDRDADGKVRREGAMSSAGRHPGF
jgi:hypothetical protein